MSKTIFTFCAALLVAMAAAGQCIYVAATDSEAAGLTVIWDGGGFASYGCADVDPTYWLDGSGDFYSYTFDPPIDYPILRVWGMNDDDTASVFVNDYFYEMIPETAYLFEKMVCGLSPGPDGVEFVNGKIVGANTGAEGNYSWQDIQLMAAGVTTLNIQGDAGAGWGFAGISLFCEPVVGMPSLSLTDYAFTVFPNPVLSQSIVLSGCSATQSAVCIYNSSGALVERLRMLNGRAIISRNRLADGIYYVQLWCDGTITDAQKIIVGG